MSYWMRIHGLVGASGTNQFTVYLGKKGEVAAPKLISLRRHAIQE